jgi:hypothetical protein
MVMFVVIVDIVKMVNFALSLFLFSAFPPGRMPYGLEAAF